MKILTRGQKIRLSELSSSTQLQVRLECNAGALGFDFSCFGLDDNGKLSDDRYFVFYNQKQSPGNEIKLLSLNATAANFAMNLAQLPPTVRRLVFVVTIDGAGNMSTLNSGGFRLADASGPVGEFSFAGRDFTTEKAIMVAEIYFKGEWRVSANGQGFKEGLSAILRHFGGQEIDSPAPPPPPLMPPVLPPTQQPNVPPPVLPPTPPSANGAAVCSDCGKTLSLLERGVNSLAGDRRCTACDRQVKQQRQMQAQLQANSQLAIRQQQIERILQGELPVVDPAVAGIVLKRGEVCHFVTHAEYYEERVTSTVRARHGVGARVRICRGVTYRVGATHGKTISITGMVRIDTGRLVLTNQRCVFDGQKKSFSVPFSKLISFEPFANGLELSPENKKTQQYKVQDGEMAAAILSTAVNL